MVRIIGFLLVGLLLSCNKKDKPKETTQDKKVSSDTVCKPIVIESPDSLQRVEICDSSIVITNRLLIKERSQLPKIILITTSEGCKCALAKCAEGEKTVNGVVRQFSEKIAFEKIDYAKERDSVGKLTQEYKFYSLPTLLFLNSKGKFTKKIESAWDEKTIKEALAELGVK